MIIDAAYDDILVQGYNVCVGEYNLFESEERYIFDCQ